MITASLFVAFFLTACGTYSYVNTHAAHRGSLLNAPDHMADQWHDNVRRWP